MLKNKKRLTFVFDSSIMDPNDIHKEYSNGKMTIVWKSGLCQHSANCMKTLPDVFKPREKPWITITNAPTNDLIEAVKKCPSGALTFYLNEK